MLVEYLNGSGRYSYSWYNLATGDKIILSTYEYNTKLKEIRDENHIEFTTDRVFEPEELNEKLHPICSMGYKFVYWSRDGDYLKFRCPHVLGKADCPHGSAWCSNSSYGYCFKLTIKRITGISASH